MSLPKIRDGLVAIDRVIPGIYKRGETYGFRANIPGSKGKQIRRGGYLTQEAAYQARIRFLSGELLALPKSGTVGAWFDEFLGAKTLECRATTVSGYGHALRRVRPFLEDFLLTELDESHLRAAYQSLVEYGYSTGTIRTAHWRVRTALRQAQREGRVTRCVAENVTAPRGKEGRKRRTWSFDQLMIFAKYTSTQRDAAMWALWVTTGLRRGEVGGLKWAKLNLDGGLVTIDWQRTITADGEIVEGPTKTENGERVIPLSPRVVSALRSWRASQSQFRLAEGVQWQGGDYVFTSIKNKPYYTSSFNDRLAHLCRRAGLPILSSHELRHTYATRAIENGADVKVLSVLLGHSRIQTTLDLYVHPSEEQGRSLNESLADRMFG